MMTHVGKSINGQIQLYYLQQKSCYKHESTKPKIYFERQNFFVFSPFIVSLSPFIPLVSPFSLFRSQIGFLHLHHHWTVLWNSLRSFTFYIIKNSCIIMYYRNTHRSKDNKFSFTFSTSFFVRKNIITCC